MILSRVCPTLIRLNHVIKLSRNAKTQLLYPSRHSVLKRCPGALSLLQIRTMSSDVDKEMSDPKRHFDYNQLVEKTKEKNVVVIDVREHSEINETGKIPGSIHIPLNDLNYALNSMSNEDFLKQYNSGKPKKDDEIIFTCRSGRRSLTAMKNAFESVAEVGKALGDMSEEDFKKQYGAGKPKKDTEVIFSCKAGGRSLKALKLGLELGYSKAGNYKGGWLDWAQNTKSS